MKGIYSKSRVGWISHILGEGRSLTERQIEIALQRMRDRGWLTAFPPQGPAYELVAVVHETHPLSLIVRTYQGGTRLFDRTAVESATNGSLNTLSAVRRLAKAGFAILNAPGSTAELRVIDPRAARMINESRCGRQERGYGVRPVIEAFQLLRKPPKRSIRITDLRRLQVEETLRTSWLIRCGDLLTDRRRVRFESTWLLPSDAAFNAAAM